jgi:hypothetical protein
MLEDHHKNHNELQMSHIKTSNSNIAISEASKSRLSSWLGYSWVAIKPYRTYLYRNKVLVITKVTTQDTLKLVSKELCHRLYQNPKLPTNTVRQSTATSQFNRSPRVAPNTFKQLVIVQKHTLTPTRIIKPPTSSVREVPPRRLP